MPSRDLHHAGRQSVSSRTQVRGLHGQPHRVDATQRKPSRAQTAISVVADNGQLDLIDTATHRAGPHFHLPAALGYAAELARERVIPIPA